LRKKLAETTAEALAAVLPITVIVFLLSVFVAPMPAGTLVLFILGAVLLIIGMGLFTMGAEMALIRMGEGVGAQLTKVKKIIIIIAVAFIMGVIVTIAEPDLLVLANLAQNIDTLVLVLTVAAGVGIFLILAIVRILFRISLSKMLIILYIFIFGMSFFVPNNFIGIAFDSGGVTTGPITVPFILAVGLGIASVRGDKDSMEDSFGLVALCSIGPILTVLILGIFFKPSDGQYAAAPIPDIVTTRDAVFEFIRGIPAYIEEVAQSLLPLLAVLIVFQIVTRRYHKRQLLRIIIGLIYVYLGLVLFMTGVNIGFIPIGQSLGADIAKSSMRWLLIPLGAVIGYFIVAAEPAVIVLKKQVEEISGGAIPGKAVQTYLSIGVAISLAIAMLRVLTSVSIYFILIPGYIIALILTFFVPKIFVGIAFDSGGVVTGPMTSTFLLPFTIGSCADPSKIMTDAFGLVALVAMTPLIAVQLMGIIYKNKMKHLAETEAQEQIDEEIFDFENFEEDNNQSK